MLRSSSITVVSSLLPPGLPPVSQPHPCCLLPLSILQNDTEFTCSLKQPKYLSCQLNPGCRVFSNQVSNTPCHRHKRNHLFLTSPFALTRLLHWFTCVQLIVFLPSGILIPVFPYRSPPSSFQLSSIRWFNNCS
jgi:hypothetical protein